MFSTPPKTKSVKEKVPGGKDLGGTGGMITPPAEAGM